MDRSSDKRVLYSPPIVLGVIRLINLQNNQIHSFARSFQNRTNLVQKITFNLLIAALPLICMVRSCDGAEAIRNISVMFSTRTILETSKIQKWDKKSPLFFNMTEIGTLNKHHFTADTGSEFDVWMDKRTPSDSEHEKDSRSLGISLSANEDKNVKDKIFFNLVSHSEPNHMDIEGQQRERYLSFDLMLDPTYETPLFWAIHLQVWQCCAGHPPFSIRVNPSKSNDTSINMDLMIANDKTESETYGKYESIGSFDITRGSWNHIVINLKPSFCGEDDQGKIVTWVNRKKVADWQGCWGYKPTFFSRVEHGEVGENLAVQLGIYRRRQTTKQVVLFDRLKYGFSDTDVDP